MYLLVIFTFNTGTLDCKHHIYLTLISWFHFVQVWDPIDMKHLIKFFIFRAELIANLMKL